MERVILLHGLHMHAWAMKPFARMLAQYGFDTTVFGYYSLINTLPQHAAALAQAVTRLNQSGEALHFVGHSLGGLVLRHFAAAYPEKISGRIVTLGAPHQGSSAAQRIDGMGLRTPLLGGSYASALDGHAPSLPVNIALGSLAGNKPQGLGRILGLSGEHDGTVKVAETVCPHMRDHVVLPVSHTGMLWNPVAALQTAEFLQHRYFRHDMA
ncbi:serine aminopeptidase domain-containing protein [Neisseria perflava]|uniref:serine aminopeptidase domain-containing protein n=1 Tax=Neisseria perflava TaxID=33053 RepID=UPI00209EF083|nr:alpha/beta hydrolase [Neisseria perflava]MCP1660341.1 pimeloyl-ACP methyl ester carboxylesterase [Neisseria perflava]MCP1772342.1 pimeloyl-ACP methyl ester carboxylesterase [Neisseria perflava]